MPRIEDVEKACNTPAHRALTKELAAKYPAPEGRDYEDAYWKEYDERFKPILEEVEKAEAEKLRKIKVIVGTLVMANSVWELCCQIIELTDSDGDHGIDVQYQAVVDDLEAAKDPNEPEASDPAAGLKMFEDVGSTYMLGSNIPVEC